EPQTSNVKRQTNKSHADAFVLRFTFFVLRSNPAMSCPPCYSCVPANAFMKLVERMSRIGTESAFEVFARARSLEKDGRSIIHLEIGEPDFPTPAHVVAAGKRALDEGWTKYGPTSGFPEFRETIAAYVSSTRHIEVTADNVCVVPGGKPIMFFTMMALVEQGDEVIYPD